MVAQGSADHKMCFLVVGGSSVVTSAPPAVCCLGAWTGNGSLLEGVGGRWEGEVSGSVYTLEDLRTGGQ